MAAQKRHIQPGGTRGTVFKQVARVRLEDAAVLLGQRRYSGAIYMAGYAIECLLKWAVTCRREMIYLPADLETHDWDILLAETGLRPRLARGRIMRGIFAELAERWGPEVRYLASEPAASQAKSLYEKLVQLYSWVEEQAA